MDAGGKDNTSVIVIEVRSENSKDTVGDGNDDPYESTYTPRVRASESFSIEQITTIKQANGQKVIIKSQISTSQQNRLVL